MTEKKSKNPILIIDIVLTVILAIVIGVGIGLAVSSSKVERPNSDEPTTQSYAEYIDMSGYYACTSIDGGR